MNEVTLTLTFTDSEFDRLDALSARIGVTRDELIGEMVSPAKISSHIRSTMEHLERMGTKTQLLMRQVQEAGQ